MSLNYFSYRKRLREFYVVILHFNISLAKFPYDNFFFLSDTKIPLYTYGMKLSEIKNELFLTALHENFDDVDVKTAYTSDLLSDVMGNAPDESLIITIQAHKNTLAVATLKDSPGIIICNSRPIPEDFLEAAKDEKVAIFLTHKNQYEISGLLYNLLNK